MSLYIGTSDRQADLVSGRISKLSDAWLESINFFYPVGAYYETSDSSFDPNVEWQGTSWIQETEMQIVQSETIKEIHCMWRRTS